MAQRVAERRCPHVVVIQRWWRSFGRTVRDVIDVSPAFKLRRCTFSSLRAVVHEAMVKPSALQFPCGSSNVPCTR